MVVEYYLGLASDKSESHIHCLSGGYNRGFGSERRGNGVFCTSLLALSEEWLFDSLQLSSITFDRVDVQVALENTLLLCCKFAADCNESGSEFRIHAASICISILSSSKYGQWGIR